MNGIDASPMHVGNHFRANPFTLAFLSNFPAPQVIRLITKPGMATEASICHRNTSPAMTADGRRPPPSTSGFYKNGKKGKFLHTSYYLLTITASKVESSDSYPIGLHRFIHAFGEHIRNRNCIAEIYENFRYQWSKRFTDFI